MSENNVKKWYIVRAVSGQENKVKNFIETEITRLGMQDYVSQVLVPVEKVPHEDKKGKKTLKDRISFPGYVVIEANLTGEVPHVIKSIAGVIGFLGETRGGDPVPLRTQEINRILGMVDEASVTEVAMVMPFNIGDNVKVAEGPFNGFTGSIEKINEEKRKLEVMVVIFGRKTPLELGFNQVERV